MTALPLDPDRLREASGGGPLGHRVQVFRETASTNDLLLQMGESGAAEGVALFAERQTAGRGQFQRPWHSADGLGLWFSILLRPRISLAHFALLAPYAAACVWEGLTDVLGEGICRIKPPNDIYGQAGKVAGILIETRSGAEPFAVLGIGINVAHQREDFPAELRDTASSLALESGRSPDRHQIASAVFCRLNARLPELPMKRPRFQARYDALVAEWAAGAALQRAEM